jgi:alpha-tubulin suppressor-like RCC1 family protein
MNYLTPFAVLLSLGTIFISHAQSVSVNLTGTVTSKATGAPIANAKVVLSNVGQATSTDSSGKYKLAGVFAGTITNLKRDAIAAPCVRNGILSFSVKQHEAPVKAELFTLQGRQAAVLLEKTMPTGDYRLSCINQTLPAQLYCLRLAIGKQCYTLQIAPLNQRSQFSSRNLQLRTGEQSTVLAKSLAAADTLQVSAFGYSSSRVTVETYNGTFDIALDAKPIAKNVFIYAVTPADSIGKAIACVSDGGSQKQIDTLLYLPTDQAIAGTVAVPAAGTSHLDIWVYDKQERVRGFVSSPLTRDTIPIEATLPFSFFGCLRDTFVHVDSPLVIKANFPDINTSPQYFWGSGLAEWQDSTITPTWTFRYHERGRFTIRSGINIGKEIIAGFCCQVLCCMPVKLIAAGEFHSLFLQDDNTLWACGGNNFGQLGDGTDTNRSTPVQIVTDIKSISAGGNHSLILKQDNSLWACGFNHYGQLGTGDTFNRLTPTQIMTDVKAIAAGREFSLILKQDSTLWACGDNGCGQLGDGTSTNRHTPIRIMNDVKDMAAGWTHSLILKQDNSLWGCGSNHLGELGIWSPDGYLQEGPYIKPVQIMTDVKSIATGFAHSLILKQDNSLWVCGDNFFGQLGGPFFEFIDKPQQIMTDVKSIAAGGSHSLIIKHDNSLWACGDNGSGQLGDGTDTNRSKPVTIMTGVKFIAAGGSHSLIIKQDNSLWACGGNFYGKLSDGTTTDRHTPVQIGF